MKKIILLTGDLAAGKSTFSRLLADRYKIPCYNKDDIKEILGDNFGFKNREENLKLSMCTFDIFKYIIEKNMIVCSDLIIESNFRQNELDYIKTKSEINGYKIITIIIRADTKILHTRFMNRINNENRHPVHKAVDFSNYNDFEKQILQDRVRNYPGSALYLDSSSFSELYDNKNLYEIDMLLERINHV